MIKKRKLKDQVLFCLENYPITRDCDKALTIKVWKMFYENFISDDGKIQLSDLYNLPSQADIQRIRAKVQNQEKLFLPTQQEVALKRKISEEDWKKYLGYYVEDKNQYRFV